MDKGPLVSVLIPCFNSQRYVQYSLQSVLCQTYKNVEVIVVDDGSDDQSCEIVASFKHRGVRLIQQENSGAATARNRALYSSSGEFVLFMDADDAIGERHLAALLQRSLEQRMVVSVSQWDRFYNTIDEATFPFRQSYRDDDGVSWLVSEWAKARPMTQPGMFLVPRSVIEVAGPWNDRCSFNDDFEFLSRVLTHCSGVRFAPDARLYYRSGMPNSLSQQRSPKAVQSAFCGLMLGVQHLLNAENSARTRRVCANILQNFAYEYYPSFPELRRQSLRAVERLGGADVEPDGPPQFHALRRLVGWQAARRVQLFWSGLKRGSSRFCERPTSARPQ